MSAALSGKFGNVDSSLKVDCCSCNQLLRELVSKTSPKLCKAAPKFRMSDKICAMMNSRRSLQLALRWEVIQCRWPHYIWFKISVSVKSFLHAMRTFTIWCFFLFGSCNLPPLSFHYCFGRSGDLSYKSRIDFSDLLWIGYRLVENFVRQTHLGWTPVLDFFQDDQT